ncbi:hypothetical protein B484DRAFT_458024 [Ochromonadaceae sp. CCMP2298]|nr:hypothetical protein B484DRAFT_458024 [Ochromonadaceae sp. CCMP2298]|mmetsp:Transcript_35540/g.78265  ORF Transcript_35540/g.78265 Transcript_35540/m.78265 type:complete len:440 (+) Transcript_35540:80-1399(+)|eukprot:CAMPEP_0173252124 /NCGR_PEP_ID=MMETSP1142-20121109/20543_1 /TAXON_ID=483371 /ORGANISM="non described non described, Strain CCMP2298" /LENGTH=439 /DNA_ID=CAMNT_0014185113 /DNA_START=16 /DNA_END=1335 /DNA_ORIENTATION=-
MSSLLIPLLALSTLGLTTADFPAIAGYQPQNDVIEHAKIDLDMQIVSGSNVTAAYIAYSQGGNSVKSSGAIRTIQGFSTGFSNMQGEKWYDIFAAYWSDPAYADTFTSSACLGTGDFSESASPLVSDTARAEACTKGAQYQNVWMYVIHEMEAALVDCNAGTIGMHWDEAVAFYVGSLPGASGSGDGLLQYTLAEKRCVDFNTCDESDDSAYSSVVNDAVFELFEQGRDYQYDHANGCANMEATKEALVQQFTIPLLQGTLKYLYFADLTESEKTRAELWAFAAALLPMLDTYDTGVAATLLSNALITNTDVVSSGYADVKYQLETLYTDMGVTCAQVGGLSSSAYASGYYPGMQPCSDASTSGGGGSNDDDKKLPVYGIVLLVVFLSVGLLAFIGFGFFWRKSHHLQLQLQDHERDGIMITGPGSRQTLSAMVSDSQV